MFTGIIAEQGRVESLDLSPATDSAVLTFAAPRTAPGLGLGGSIAVNGVCLTAVALDGSRVSVDVMGETLTRTTTGSLQPGQTRQPGTLRAGRRAAGRPRGPGTCGRGGQAG